MTTFVSREEWDARPREAGTTDIVDEPSVTFHYEGDGIVYPWAHSRCAEMVRSIQNYHMDDREWSDIAYNYLVCPHDYCFEGRGYDRRSSANGNDTYNNLSFAVCALWGAKSGSILPEGLKRAYMYARQILITKGNATKTIYPHHHWHSTSCPGVPITAWINAGCPITGVITPPDTDTPGDDDMFTDTDRARLNWIYGTTIDSDGTPSVTTLLLQQAKKIEELTGENEAIVRRYALWETLYGLQTEDDRAQALAAYNAAIETGKTVDEARTAATDVLTSLMDSIKKSQLT